MLVAENRDGVVVADGVVCRRTRLVATMSLSPVAYNMCFEVAIEYVVVVVVVADECRYIRCRWDI